MEKIEKYAYISEPVSIDINMDEILLIVDDKKGKNGEKLYNVNEDALNILKRFTGQYKLKEIIEQLSIYYNEKFDETKTKLISFLNLIESTYDINIKYSIDKINKEIKIKDNQNNYLPRTISIELTHKCNFKCLHCYGGYDNEKSEMMDTNKLKQFIGQCKNLGVQAIELTGGEITMHPDICEILEYIYQLDFKMVSLLTNGFIKNEKLYDLIVSHKENTIVQIDMHGNTESYLNWFTQVPNTKKRVEENIKFLHNNGVFMRVVTVATPLNIEQIEDIADWVHDIGIKSYGISPVIPTGRANEESEKLLFTSTENLNKLEDAIYNITQKYGKKFLNLLEDYNSMRANCGAFVINASIAPNGDLKVCSMDGLDVTNSIGNVFKENIKDIYEKNLDLLKKYKNLESPNLNMEGCKNCEHVYFCQGCVLRGFSKGVEIGDKCYWLKNIVPTEVKEKLLDIPVMA